MKWTTKIQYVHLETGEQLTEQEVKTNYTIIKKTKKYEINESAGRSTRIIIVECQRSTQTNLF